MSRFARNVDANQATIVQALRRVGAIVQHLHAVGSGCPDLLVGYRGRMVLLELKDGSKPPSARRLTPLETEWHARWEGYPVAIVHDVEEALAAIGVGP